MKHKKMVSKLLSIMLSLVVFATSALSGVCLVDVTAEEASAAQQVAVSENDAETSASSDTEVSEESVLETDVTTDETQVEAAEESTEETVEEAEASDQDVESLEESDFEEKEDEKGIQEEDVKTRKKEVDDALLMKNFVPDKALQQALVKIYNAQETASVTVNDMTMGQMKEIQKLDLSGNEAITSVKGLGYASKATDLDLSGTGISVIEKEEFFGNTKLKTLILPDELKGIGNSAFEGCTGLTSIVSKTGNTQYLNRIPSKLEEDKTGSNIFKKCSSLTTVVIDNVGTRIQGATGMFSYCTSLTSVTIGSEVANIPNSAFENAGADGGMTVTFNAGCKLAQIGAAAFASANVKTIDFSNCSKLSLIGDRCFASSGDETHEVKLEEIRLPKGAKSLVIGKDAFFKAPLSSMYTENKVAGTIVLPSYVISVGEGAFYKNTEMKKLQLSVNMKAIEKYTFDGCENLTEVIYSSTPSEWNCNISRIGNAAFRDTKKLTSAAFVGKMNNLTIIGDDKLEVYGKDLVQEHVYKTNREPGVAYGCDVFRRSAIEDIVFPRSLKIINSRSFYEASKLKKVEWKNESNDSAGAVFEINSEAFALCNVLTRFCYRDMNNVSNATFELGPMAFSECEKLTVFAQTGEESVNALPKVTKSVGVMAFEKCILLPSMAIVDNAKGEAPELGELIFFECHSLAYAELPSKLKTVPEGMYYDAGLKNLPTINGDVNIEVIDTLAFFGNKIQKADMSKWTKLQTIGEFSFAYSENYLTGEFQYADELLSEDGASLVAVILPDEAPNGICLGNSAFNSAHAFTTLSTKSKGKTGVVFIPNYIENSMCGGSVFSSTSVSEVVWEFTQMQSGANVWDNIPNGMFFGANIVDLSKACLPAAYLKRIGETAYSYNEKMKEIDLSPYLLLEETGNAAFSNCLMAKKIVLPDNGLYKKVSTNCFRIGTHEGVSGGKTEYYSLREEIDFGGVEEIGENAFASYNDFSVGGEEDAIWPTALKNIDFTGTKVKTIAYGAFKGNDGLEKVNFGSVETIGPNSFARCVTLCMTGMPISDSVKTIGDEAFWGCEALGEVVFGANVGSIGASAFERCARLNNVHEPTYMYSDGGLVSLDFSKVKEIKHIGTAAFKATRLEKLDLTNANIVDLSEPSVFADNPYLKEVQIGESVVRVGSDVFAGCIDLDKISFYSTTIMNKDAFKSGGVFTKPGKEDNLTPIQEVTMEVLASELNVGLGKSMSFPYYVNEYTEGEEIHFDEIWIGDSGNKDASVVEYVKVMAPTTGYYLNEMKGERITDPTYFEELTDVNRLVTRIGSYAAKSFEIQGLKPTPEGVSIPFSINNNFRFTSGEETVCEKSVSVRYNLKVMDIPYYPVIYTDAERTMQESGLVYHEQTGLTTGTTCLRAYSENPGGAQTFYYDIKTLVNSTWQPENGNIIIKSSNPDVLQVEGATLVEGSADTWRMEAPYEEGMYRVSDTTKGKGFTLVPKKHGDAVVTIYAEGCPQKTITWSIRVRADISEVSLDWGEVVSNGIYPGLKTQMWRGVSNYLGQTVSYENGDLFEYSKITDDKIKFWAPEPEYLSVDQNGVVTFHKVKKELKLYLIFAVIKRADGTEENIDFPGIETKYKDLSYDTPCVSDAGEQVQLLTGEEDGKMPTVKYLSPAPGATSVTVPSTMEVYGVKCKVTEIDANAFKGNKNLKSVTLGKYIKVIPAKAFRGCTALTSVTFKGNVKEIGASAFEKCSALKKIVIPKTVTKIGKKAFSNCKKLSSVTFKSGSKLKTIGSSAFEYCVSLKKITLPKNVTSIGSKAFYKDKKLSKIIVKSTKVKTVGKNAFAGIYKKAIIDVPKKVLGKYKSLFKKGQGKKVKIK